ncbi:MAG: hypothetical protein GY856_15135, partial [bacterium]|nr:hypothetical protein [bacterium]
MAEKKQDPSSVETRQKTAHDETFKTAFREFFADLIELVDSELAATLDLAHAKIQEEDPFADFPGGQVGRADLVAETPAREGEHEMVMVHVEVSGKFLDVMDRRMRRYGLHIELKHDKPVVPIAVFLTGGRRGWSCARWSTRWVNTGSSFSGIWRSGSPAAWPRNGCTGRSDWRRRW